MLEVAALALPLLDPLRAKRLLLSSFLVLLHHRLTADSFRVLPVLLITSEDPHHAVLQDPLLISFHMPLAESVDICSMVDILVHQVIFGFHFVAGLELDLLRVHARIETGAGVLAVEH